MAERVPATTPTFRDCAEALVASKRPGWRNPKHVQQWENTLRDFVLPHIGDKTPDAVSLADVKDHPHAHLGHEDRDRHAGPPAHGGGSRLGVRPRTALR